VNAALTTFQMPEVSMTDAAFHLAVVRRYYPDVASTGRNELLFVSTTRIATDGVVSLSEALDHGSSAVSATLEKK
jgi:hypothetical protein